MIFFLYIIQYALILFLISILIMLFMWVYSGFKSKVPFVPVPSSVLPEIKKLIDLKDDSIVYDLGCGEGRVLFYLSKFKPSASYIGIENSLFPLTLAYIKLWWYKKILKNNSVKILNKDFFTQDLSQADYIFVYLYPNVLDDLLPKFDQELKPGTKVVSASFKFTQKQPTKEYDLGRNKYKLARKLYIYEF